MRRVSFVLSLALPASVLLLAAPAAYATTVTIPTVAHTVSAGVHRVADLRLPSPVTRVATYWRGAPDARVTVSFSADGRAFSAPLDAGRDEVGEQRGNGITYGAVRVAAGARVVRVTTDRPLARVWVDGMADGTRLVRRVGQPATASAAVTQPAVLARSAWSADESLRYKADGTLKEQPTYHPSKKLIVHHTDTTNADPDPAATIRAIYRYHVQTQGWSDIGYNFLVDESGRAWEGRWSRAYDAGVSPSGDDARGYGVTGSHTGGWNSGTVGIALLGSLMDRDAAPAARTALVDLLAWEADKNGLDPRATTAFTNPVSGAVRTTPNIAGHLDYTATLCPGDRFYATLPQIREDVAARMGLSAAPPPDSAAPTAPTVSATPGSRSVALSWTGAADNVAVTGYDVLRASSSGGTYTKLASTAGTSYVDKGLKNGRTYWYRVRAYDAAGNRSPDSNTVSATPR